MRIGSSPVPPTKQVYEKKYLVLYCFEAPGKL